jgi:AraC-like DNA-binding protein
LGIALTVMKQLFSTEAVPREQRVRYWEDLISQIFTRFEVEIDQVSVEDFYGDVVKESTESLDIFEISTNAAHSARHPGREVETLENAAIVIVLQVEGEGSIFQDGRHDVIEPGDLTLFDASRGFELRFDGPTRQFVLSIPWQTVQRQLISPRRVTGMGISGSTGVGGVASEFISAFVQQASSMKVSEREGLTRSLIDIINAAVISRLSQSSLSRSDYVEFQLNTARMYVEERLRDPELSPAVVAAAIGVSQRYLNKLFESENLSLSRLIWQRRLENCRKDLQDPRLAGKSITKIAHSWGFKSSSHFSRSFKDAFGVSPREIRAKCD